MKVDPDIKKIFTKHEIIGLVAQDTEYGEILIKVSGILSKNYNKILYLSVNKPYKTLIKEFKQNKIDINKFHFIDCITRTSSDVEPTKNCTYVSSPKAMDEIQTAIMDILRKQKIDITLIDSPSYLLTYYEHMGVLQFVHRLMAELTVAGCKGIFPFRKESADHLRRSIEMFTDVAAYFYIAEVVLKMRILK